MATIANLVIQIGANASGIKVALDQANSYLRQFANTAQNSFRTINRGLRSGAITGGQDAADLLLHNLNARFNQSVGNVREQMFRGLITRKQAETHMREASAGFNAGLLAGIEELRARNLLPPHILEGLQRQLKDAGLRGAKELVNGLEAGMLKVGNQLESIGQSLTKNITVPLVGAGGLFAKFAGEAEVSAGRMEIVWGPMTGKIEESLRGLHEVIPETMANLRSMTAITSELLLPLGIAPDKVAEMAVSFVSLSKDLAILNNIKPERAMHALQSSLVGMTRPLKLLGVDITDLGIKQEAQRMGLVKEGQTLNETGKALAAYSLVMQRSALVQKGAQKLSETFLVQMRFMKRDAIEAAIALGNQLIPALLPLIKIIKDVLQWLSSLSPETLRWILALMALAAALGPTAYAMGKMILVARGLLLAIKLLRTEGFAALAVFLATNPVALALTAIAVAIGAIVLEARAGANALKDLQSQFATFSKDATTNAVRNNADTMRKLVAERDRLLQQPQKQLVTLKNPMSGLTSTTETDTAAARRVAEINSLLKQRATVAVALGQRFEEITKKENLAAAELEDWNKKMKEFSERGETAVDKVKTALDKLRDSVSLTVDRLELFRELKLDISEPLATAQTKMQDLIDSQGGLNNLAKGNADVLQLILQLQKAINAAIDERANKPVDDARTALEALRNVRETAIDTVNIDVSVVDKAFADARDKLAALDRAIAGAGDKATPEALRLSSTLHRLLGSTSDFVETINDDLIAIAGVGDSLPVSAVQAGLQELYANLLSVGATNAKRFAQLKSGFGQEVTTPEGNRVPGVDIAGGALDMLKSAALGVAEGFTPLAILAKLISAALEPLQPALDALLLPVTMVAKVLGSALIPVLRLLFPVFKLVAIAASFVAEIFYRVAAAIVRAIGSLVRGLGRLVNKLPGSPGDPLVKAGQGLLDLADGFTDSANELKRTRKELQDMSFDDAISQVKGLASAARDASHNIPQIFKLAQRVFQSANPYNAVTPITTVTATPTPVTPSGGGVGGTPTRNPYAPTTGPVMNFGPGSVVINGANKPVRQLFDEIEAEGVRRSTAQTGMPR